MSDLQQSCSLTEIVDEFTAVKLSGTQEEAAEAYDIAAIKFRGLNAVTNFDITRYDVERIMASNTLLPGELARRNKAIESGNAEDRNNNNNNNAIDQKSSIAVEDYHGMFNIDNNNNNNTTQLSNTSSLVSSLSSSREGSPDRNGLSVLFAKPLNSWIAGTQQQQQLRPSAAVATMAAQLPVFAAWNDV